MLTNINQKQIFLQIESKNLSYTKFDPRLLLKILHSGIFIFCSRKSGRDCVFITFYGLSVTLPSRFFLSWMYFFAGGWLIAAVLVLLCSLVEACASIIRAVVAA